MEIFEIDIWLTLRNLFKIILFFYFVKTLIFVYKNLLRKRKNFAQLYGRKSWAFVTGASDGIGRAICDELAKAGFNIILVSRTLKKLEKAAEELQKLNPGIETKIIAYDFSKEILLEDYIKKFSELPEKYDISILVNNVGSDQHVAYEEQKIEEIWEQINMNIKPQTIITKLFMDKIKKRQSRSAIICLSSFASDFPFPMKAVYSASKIYNHYQNRALELEFNHFNYNIDFLSVRPLEVSTPMTPKYADGVMVISAKQCAQGIFNDLGYESTTEGHWIHKIQAALILLFPQFITNKVLTTLHKMFI
jgi:17beta-estradiol 17-dehydrogenase / very-long-chain 3-oxoacyl-CoA reductase